MDSVADVFCVGPCGLERWRPFVDVHPATGDFDPRWTPEGHHDRLMAAHRRAARVLYEHALAYELFGGPDADSPGARRWITRPIHGYFKLVAEVELRCVEVEIASFQLTTGTLGITTDRARRDDLYAAAAFAHACHLHLYDTAGRLAGRRTGRGEIAAERPSRTDSPRTLASTIDKQLFSVHWLVTRFLPRARGRLDEADVPPIAARLGLMVRALDKVLVPCPDSVDGDAARPSPKE
jgi:hypothetical protein